MAGPWLAIPSERRDGGEKMSEKQEQHEKLNDEGMTENIPSSSLLLCSIDSYVN